MTSNPAPLSRRMQRGSTLIEVLGALAVAAFALSSFAYMANDAVDNSRAALVGNAMAEFNAGATRFVNTRYRQFYDPELGTVWGVWPNQFKQFRAEDLLGEGGVRFLPEGFDRIGPTGQVPCLVVTKNDAGEILAYTYLTSPAGSRPLHTPLLRRIAAGLAGPNVAVIESVPDVGTLAPTVTAVSGAWSAKSANLMSILNATGTYRNFRGSNTCDGGNAQVGDLVAMVTLQGVGGLPGSATSGYLHRDTLNGHPELNQMKTSLDMTGNDINNIGNAQATGQVTAGSVSAGQVNAGQVAAGDINATGNIAADGTVSAPYLSAGRQVTAEELVLNGSGMVNEGAFCSRAENGLLRLMRDASGTSRGRLGVCIDNVWTAMSELGSLNLRGDTQVIGASGSQKIGELIMQWGIRAPTSPTELGGFAFPQRFPHDCLFGTVTTIRDGPGSVGANHVGRCDSTGMSYTTDAGVGTRWFAIGW